MHGLYIYGGLRRRTQLTILVADCNHWIGYHIANTLLENDYKVDGMVHHNHDGQELSMFFGRNSSFSIPHSEEYNDYKLGIFTGGYTHPIQQRCERMFIINPTQDEINNSNHSNRIVVKADLLFGEWMPMNEQGIFKQKQLIPFASDYFKQHAIYIRDFTDGLMQWMKASNLPSILHIHSKKSSLNTDTKLEKNVFLRENITNGQNVIAVMEHYRLHRKT